MTAPSIRSLPQGGSARVERFIQRYIRLPRGTRTVRAGSHMRVLAWHHEVISGIYDRNPRPRQALISIAKKNSKTTLAAALALYHLTADGEEGAEVLIGSSDTETAMICWRFANRMVEMEDRLGSVIRPYRDRLVHVPTDSVLSCVSGDPDHAQGRGPSFAVIDEVYLTHADLWDNLLTGMAARRNPVLLGISTMGPVMDDENLMTRLTKVGRAGGDSDFYFREWTAPLNCSLTDRSAWAAANPALGTAVTEAHLASVVKNVRESRFRAFHLNQAAEIDGAWMPAGAWDLCAEPGGIPDGTEVVIALDGSYNGDSTALVAATVSPRPHIDTIGFWQPKLASPVDIVEVEDAIRAACKTWNVKEVVADPYRWARSLQILAKEGIPVVEAPQSPQRMTPATTGLYEAVMNRQVTQSGNADLARHVSHAVVKEDVRGVRLAKPAKNSPMRIDLAVCAVMAHARATFWARQPPKRRRAAGFR